MSCSPPMRDYVRHRRCQVSEQMPARDAVSSRYLLREVVFANGRQCADAKAHESSIHRPSVRVHIEEHEAVTAARTILKCPLGRDYVHSDGCCAYSPSQPPIAVLVERLVSVRMYRDCDQQDCQPSVLHLLLPCDPVNSWNTITIEKIQTMPQSTMVITILLWSSS